MAQSLIEHTEEAIKLLQHDQIGTLYKQLTPSMKSLLSKKKLEEGINITTQAFGPIKSHGRINLDTNGGKHGTITDLYLEKNSLLLILEFQGNQISKLAITLQSYAFPPSARNIAYGKKLLTVQTDTFRMEGELIYPILCTSCPVVILVHGSGPIDMDFSYGPNKVFKDIALELALQGIATFRYDKRSHVYPNLLSPKQDFTLAEETTDDVASAIQMLKNIPEIDSSKIFVLGHSLGGYAIPRIGLQNPELAGLIMMGAPYVPLFQLVEQQFQYLFSLDDKRKRFKKKVLKRASKEVELLNHKTYSKLKKKRITTGYWPNSFFIDLENYQPAIILDSIDIPVLLLQGNRDYQIPDTSQFRAYQLALEHNVRITFELFDGLNHFFLYGEGPPTPMEYVRPGHVPSEVILTIANWVFLR